MNKFVLNFVKITGAPIEFFYCMRETFYMNPSQKNEKGPALVVSNHTAVSDYITYLYLFWNRILHPLTAEIIYNKGKLMSCLLNCLGSIRVNRFTGDFSFINETIEVLNNGDMALVFPEGKIPDKESTDLLKFTPSFVYIALESKAPIIPIYTNGMYGKKKRNKIIVGEKIYLQDLYDDTKSMEENIEYLTEYTRQYIKMLGDKLNELESKKEVKASSNI